MSDVENPAVVGEVGNTPEENESRMDPPSGLIRSKNKPNWLLNFIRTKQLVDTFQSRTASVSGMPATSKKVILPHDDMDNNRLLTEELFRYGVVHEELIHLTEISIPPNPANRQWSYDNNDIAQFITRMVAMTIIGDGILVNTDNPLIKHELKFFLNYMRGPLDSYTINDLVVDILEDNVVHQHHLSILLEAPFQSLDDAFDIGVPDTEGTATGLLSDSKSKKETVFIPKEKDGKKGKPIKYISTGKTIHVQKIDGRTYRRVKHPTSGKLKFVQTIYGPSKVTTTREFASPKFNPTMITAQGIARIPDQVQIYISQINPKQAFYIRMFNRPPIATVVDSIGHRKWLLWAMKKVGLKFAAPVPIVQVGNAEFFTEDLATRLIELQAVSDYLADMRFGDGIALDHNMTWVKDTIGSQTGFEFTKVIQYLERMIALAIGSSMSLFEASGAELATSRTVQDTFLRWVAGQRDKIAKSVEVLCYKYLKVRGIPFYMGEFDIKWSVLRERMMGEVVNAGVNLWNSGTILDLREGRALFKGIFDLEEIGDDKNKDYLKVIEDKEYAVAAGKNKAQLELIKAQNAEMFKHTKKMVDAGLMPDPNDPATPGGTSGSSGAKQPGSGKPAGGGQETQQGSLTGNTQPGGRKPGPQIDQSGQQTGSEREEQNTGKK